MLLNGDVFVFYYRFNPAELAFLAEYNAVMSPVAQATNILQAEENVQMGWLLPTSNLLTAKLDRVKLTVKYCRPLVDALQVRLDGSVISLTVPKQPKEYHKKQELV